MPKQAKQIRVIPDSITGTYYLTDTIISGKSEEYFNKRYVTKKANVVDSIKYIDIQLIIEKEKIYYNAKIEEHFDSTKFDTASLIKRFKNEEWFYENQWLVFRQFFSDTLYRNNRRDILKKYLNDFYINQYVSKKEWDIYKLSKNQNNTLEVGTTNKTDKAQLLSYFSKNKRFPTDIVHLSNQQFISFVKSGGFRDRFHFNKR